jgi:SAM-dependent methyltransferase
MGDRSRHDFDAIYREGSAPWELGRPQGAVAALAEAGRFVGSVLDVGCGSGEHALLLAARGHQVVGLDGSAEAIALARRKAAERRLASAQFHVWDALELGRLRRSFDTVLDCGLFHLFDDEERRRYARSLAEVAPPGTDLFLLCFSDAEPPGPGPRRVQAHELGDTFRPIFAVMEVEPAQLERREGPPARAWLARLTRI